MANMLNLEDLLGETRSDSDESRATLDDISNTSGGNEVQSPPVNLKRKREPEKATSSKASTVSSDSYLDDLDDSLPPEIEKPALSYVALISMAILGDPEQRLLLGDIYKAIINKFPYYRYAHDKAWKNSIRHNLSLNECFIKDGRSPDGKGNFWAVHPACLEDFKKGDFRRRQARRRAKRSQAQQQQNQQQQSENFTERLPASTPTSYYPGLPYIPQYNQQTMPSPVGQHVTYPAPSMPLQSSPYFLNSRTPPRYHPYQYNQTSMSSPACSPTPSPISSLPTTPSLYNYSQFSSPWSTISGAAATLTPQAQNKPHTMRENLQAPPNVTVTQLPQYSTPLSTYRHGNATMTSNYPQMEQPYNTGSDFLKSSCMYSQL